MGINNLYTAVDVSRDFSAEKVRRRFQKAILEEYANQIAIQHARAMGLGLQSTLTLEDWAKILEKYQWSCAYCSAREVPLDIEHSHPISRGGHNVPENVVPSCPSCNSSKGDMTVEEWIAKQKAQQALECDERFGGTVAAFMVIPQNWQEPPLGD